jgi:hypothetical protein
VDEEDTLGLEEGGRVPRLARLEQPVERPERAAARADAARGGVGDHLEGELARVEPVLAPPLQQRTEGAGLPLRGGRDEDGVEETHGA